MARQPLIIRTDADTRIGVGHLMRCLALGQAWQDAGGSVILVMGLSAPTLEGRIIDEGMEIIHLAVAPGSAGDASETARLAQGHKAGWVVVDGYHFGADYQHLIKEADCRLLFIDDYGHASRYWADLVLNQNIQAHEGLYLNRESYTRLLLGTSYVLLRREFQAWRGWQRQIPDVAKKILVTLGGSDPGNVTLKVIRALSMVEMDGLEIVVVVGGANPHFQELQSAVNNFHHRIGLLTNVDDMPELMAWADLAISGGGSTCWEMAFMGLPAIIVILAENQEPVIQRLREMGAVLNLGWHNILTADRISQVVTKLLQSPKIRQNLMEKAQSLVSADGGTRVLKEIDSQLP